MTFAPGTGMLTTDRPTSSEPQLASVSQWVTIFRALAMIRLLIGVVFLVVPGPEIANLQWSQSVTVLEVTLLLVYLAVPPLQKGLGRLYLPVAIVWSTLVPMLVQNLTLYWEFERLTRAALEQSTFDAMENTLIVSSINQTLLVLIVPLIVVAWAYSRRVLILYCLGIAVFDLLISTLFIQTAPMVFLVGLALIVFRTLLYGVIGIVIHHLVGVQLEQQRRLMAANEKLKEFGILSEHLATSRERNRIARELHDTLAHTLSVATVQLEAVSIIWEQQPLKAREMVSKSATMMRDGLAETRRALQALRAGSLDNENLVNAISMLAESLMTRYPLAIEVQAASPITITDGAVEHGLYRILQEAMFNAAHHARAARLTVAFEPSPRGLVMTVTDDGIGFDPDAARAANGHFGLRGMQERAQHIQADLHIVSRAGAGTTVVVRWEHEHD